MKNEESERKEGCEVRCKLKHYNKKKWGGALNPTIHIGNGLHLMSLQASY